MKSRCRAIVFITRDEYLERARSNIVNYESIPGHLFQSASQSSFDTWIQFFSRGPNAGNTTISCYDKGAALGMLLDLKIRNETKNRKSLDDVMRTLYQQLRILLSRRGAIRELDVVLGKNTERSFRITPLPNPTPLQTAILEGWLKGQ